MTPRDAWEQRMSAPIDVTITLDGEIIYQSIPLDQTLDSVIEPGSTE